MTIQPGDGALPGEYKVVLSVWESYTVRKSVVADQFTTASSTPLSAVILEGDPNHFDFVVKRPQISP